MIVRTSTGIEVSVHRTDRVRSADLFVEASTVRLVVPKRLSDQQIERIVKAKSVWIGKKLRLNSAVVVPKRKEFISGESVQYLGKNYRLKVTRGTNDHVALRSGRLEVFIAEKGNSEIAETRVRSLLVAWYREKALKKLSEKVERYSKRLSVQPQSVKVRDYKSRWGSCIFPNTVSFNWRIIMAPHKVIDYVVVHELCHLKHHDHSDKFWSTVSQIVRDSDESRLWLKTNSQSYFSM